MTSVESIKKKEKFEEEEKQNKEKFEVKGTNLL